MSEPTKTAGPVADSHNVHAAHARLARSPRPMRMA
jgi:hypothetical protein